MLHDSATYPDQDIGAAEIDRMHRARGFASMGYHYVIRRDGRVEKGRLDHVQGAHVSGHNSGSIGICSVGGVERATGPNVGIDNRTEAQKAATVALLRDLLARHPGAAPVGHRDLGATQCPGFDIGAWWAAVNAPAPEVVARPAGGFWVAVAGLMAALVMRRAR